MNFERSKCPHDKSSQELEQAFLLPAFSGSIWIKSYHDANLPATQGFPKVVKVGLGGQVVNKAWRRAINHGLSRSRARCVNTRGDIYSNARKLCVCSSSFISFQPLVHHHASSTMINVKNSAIKSEKKSAVDEGKGEDTLSPNIGCSFIKHHRFRLALISFPSEPSSSIPFLYYSTIHAQHFFIYCSFDLGLNALINDQFTSWIRFIDY